MRLKFWFPLAAVLIVGGAVAWLVHARLQEAGESVGRGAGARAVPVEVAVIQHGPIELRRTFTGSLEAGAELVVAPKVGGRIERLHVDLADAVERGQVVAELDNAEYIQAVTQAEADLAVARANLTEAQSQLELARRELARATRLRERGMSSESQLDAAKADARAKRAHLQVARAQVTRARAALQTARIRLGYTEVTADWHGGGDRRVVAERYVDEGETVSANAALLRIVELDPITAVLFVTERDYARLQADQHARFTTDAHPGASFVGRIARIAPVFRENTRQARVELRVDNPELRLKPGMFVRATVVMDRVAGTTIVPRQALTRRDGRSGVFVVEADGESVAWREVEVGIRQDERVQVSGGGLEGRVVTLGQQLLDDGSPVSITDAEAKPRP